MRIYIYIYIHIHDYIFSKVHVSLECSSRPWSFEFLHAYLS